MSKVCNLFGNIFPFIIGHNSSTSGFTALKDGEVFGITARINNTRTAGNAQFSVLLNGVAQNGAGETTLINAGNPQGNFQVITTPISFSAGDVLNIQSSTTSFAPAGADAVGALYIRDL